MIPVDCQTEIGVLCQCVGKDSSPAAVILRQNQLTEPFGQEQSSEGLHGFEKLPRLQESVPADLSFYGLDP